MEGIFVPIFLFGATALVLWKYFDGRHRERIAMVEKGMAPGSGNTSPRKLHAFHPLTNLKWGLLAVFIGIGLFVGHWLHWMLNIQDGPAYFGTALVFGGLALIIYYFIAARKLKETE